MNICTCNKKAVLNGYGIWVVPVEGGDISFELYECICGNMDGYPHENLLLFLNIGDKKLIQDFKNRFNIMEKN